MKFPACDLEIVRSGSCVTVVGSLAVLLPVLLSPPPDTETELVTLDAAFPATSTVNVIVEVPDAAIALLDVQVTVWLAAEQLQPVPVAEL